MNPIETGCAALMPDEARKIDAYWRAANYLSAGMIYLRANPLLREPLNVDQIKRRLLRHWGTDPGQSFIWVHLNRMIKKFDLNVMYIAGPGHAHRLRWQTAFWRAITPRSTPSVPPIRLECSSCFDVSLFQAELADPVENEADLRILENWLRSYRPEELFDNSGTLIEELRAMAPVGPRRISANPRANGGRLLEPLDLPELTRHAVPVSRPGMAYISPTATLGNFLRDVMRKNMSRFRVFGPDENSSNKLMAIYEASNKTWNAEFLPSDAEGGHLARDGRVMEMLSEHTLEGWFEGRRICPNRSSWAPLIV